MSSQLSPGRSTDRQAVGQVALLGLFVTALVTAQLTATKLLSLPLPTKLPVVDTSILLPGAALAYALTFFASDCYSELYGRYAAQIMVNVGFALNFVVLLLVWSTILAPGANPEFAATFREALAPSVNIVLGSLVAYLVSQNWDVIVFHKIREYTGRDQLWLRNLASTATSQAIDTVIFIGIAFSLAPRLLDVGPTFSTGTIVSLIVGQYLLKLLIAVADTPFVYLVVRLIGRVSGKPDPGAFGN